MSKDELHTSTSNGTPTDVLTIAVRAFVDAQLGAAGHGDDDEDVQARPSRRRVPRPSEWTLIFDTETTTDAAQRLRLGFYQVRRQGELDEEGVFYDEAALADTERELIKSYAALRKLRPITVQEFVYRVFLRVGYHKRATIVGFNLPFDISRLAIDWTSARRGMRGGFSLAMTNAPRSPRTQVRHLSQRLALIQFAGIGEQPLWRSQRKRGDKPRIKRGFFVDVRTIAAALTSRSLSLAELAKFLKTPTQKAVGDHGSELTSEYLDYARRDVQVTWECFGELEKRYELHQLTRTPLHRIYSEASLGKAYFRRMGITPWQAVQPDFPPELLGVIWSTYCGGRAETHIRRQVVRVFYCDFLSMYPTVCTLMGLWRFITARGTDWQESTEDVNRFLHSFQLDTLQDQNTWKLLTTIVQVEPCGEVFPVRARYGGDSQYTIGLNRIAQGGTLLWFTLADSIAAALLSGRPPKIIKAITYSPKAIEPNLKPIAIAGNPRYRVDPRKEDFFKRLIELRREVKALRDSAGPEERDRLDAEQLQLKILANSTGYGIYAEVNIEELSKATNGTCYSGNGTPYRISLSKLERPGTYYHPLLATLITSAARLMLAIAEHLACRNGLDWVFCDTDSMAFAKPERMAYTLFYERIGIVQQWFEPLNPYKGGGALLQSEKHNFRLANRTPTKELEPLYCLAISSKRYVLFNLDRRGRPIIRKASAHGLGHLLPPYEEAKGPRSIPKPAVPLAEIGCDRWQYDFWYRIALAALEGHPDQVDLSGIPGIDVPAASRYAATTPELLNWFDGYNRDRAPHDRVRPYNFLLAFQARQPSGQPSGLDEQHLAGLKRRRKIAHQPRPVTPYDAEVPRAAQQCFDRETGEPVPADQLKTYREVLQHYHRHPETKFLNGDYADRGATERRSIEVAGVVNIGKEANELEEQFYLGADPDAQPEYGMSPESWDSTLGRISVGCRRFGRGELAAASGVSLGALAAILKRKARPTPGTLARLLGAMAALGSGEEDWSKSIIRVLELARQEVHSNGLRQFAARLQTDPANLAKCLSGRRRTSNRLVQALQEVFQPRNPHAR